MKFKYILFFTFLLSLLVFIKPKPTFAAYNCSIANWNPDSRNLTTCIGGFDTVDQINNTVADFHCLGNSNAPDFLGTTITACTGVEGNIVNMSGYTNCIGDPNCKVAVDANGKYYTCLTGQGLSRGIGKIEVRYSKSSSRICTTNAIYTRPSNWDPLTEGLYLVSPEPGHTGTGAELECLSGGLKGVNTAIGCIPTDFTGGGFVTALLRLAVGIGSGIALLLILYGIFIVTTSTGIPDKLNAGRDIITSAIAGLIFIILSIFLLNLIGVKILAIPGL